GPALVLDRRRRGIRLLGRNLAFRYPRDQGGIGGDDVGRGLHRRQVERRQPGAARPQAVEQDLGGVQVALPRLLLDPGDDLLDVLGAEGVQQQGRLVAAALGAAGSGQLSFFPTRHAVLLTLTLLPFNVTRTIYNRCTYKLQEADSERG